MRTVTTIKKLDGRIKLKPSEVAFSERTVFDPAEMGKALRLRRRELGLTQRDVATMTGRSLRVIGDIERGGQRSKLVSFSITPPSWMLILF